MNVCGVSRSRLTSTAPNPTSPVADLLPPRLRQSPVARRSSDIMKIFYVLTTFLIVSATCAGGEKKTLTGVAYRLQRGRAPAQVAVYVERVSGQRYVIVEVIQLTPDQITSLQRHLRGVSTTSESDNFCGHDPGFAVVLSRGAYVVYEMKQATVSSAIRLAGPESPEPGLDWQ